MSRLFIPAVLAAFVVIGCEATEPGGTGGSGGSGGVGDAGTGGHLVGCDLEPDFHCVLDCRTDWFHAPECKGEYWECPLVEVAGMGQVQTFAWNDCPSDICGGPPPFPGEICREGRWICEPSAHAWAECPSTICVTCEGFPSEGIERDGCACTCSSTGQEVVCRPASDD